MLKYVLSKFGWLGVTLISIVILVFLMVHGSGIDPCLMPKATPSVIEACHVRWGLDQPIHIQLVTYLKNLAHFDLGESYQHEGMKVSAIIAEGLPHTLKLVGLALPLGLLLGTFIGVIAAIRRNSTTDYTLMGIALVGVAVPEFVVGPVLILLVCMKLEWIEVTQGLAGSASYILPVLTLALPLTAAVARLARGGMLEVLSADYIRTARAKGIAEHRVIIRHAIRLGLTPVVSYIGPVAAEMIAGGSFIVETLFGIPGIGLHFVQASTSSPIDYPLVMGATIMLATLVLLMNFSVDILYAVLDPRLRGGKTQQTGKKGSWTASLGTFALLAGIGAVGLLAVRYLLSHAQSMTRWFEESPSQTGSVALVLTGIWIAIGIFLVRTYRRAQNTHRADHGYSPAMEAWKRIAKHRAAVVSAVVLYAIVLACIFGPWLMEHAFGITYDSQTLTDSRMAPPFMSWFGTERCAGWRHLLGTDKLGRDILVRILIDGRVSLSIGMAALIVSASIGILYGTFSAYTGGAIDNLMMRFVDILFSIPYLILVILLVAFLGRSILLLFIAIGCVSWLTLARITRGQVLSIQTQPFIDAARVYGASTWRIITKHLIPNALGPIIIYATRLVALLILEEAFLSFLGMGVQEPMSSWGILIRQGNEVKDAYWWMLAFPSLTLFITLYALNYLGDGLRDALDPKLKGVK